MLITKIVTRDYVSRNQIQIAYLIRISLATHEKEQKV